MATTVITKGSVTLVGGATVPAQTANITFSTSSTQYAIISFIYFAPSDIINMNGVQTGVGSGSTIYPGGLMVPPSTTVVIAGGGAVNRQCVYTLFANS